jgi:hypothetical protein
LLFGSVNLLAPLFLATALTGAAAPAQTCSHRARDFIRKADLPAGARAVLFPMAERDEPVQMSDAIRPGPRRPFSRFLSARQKGCRLSIRYEYGGFAHGFATALLEQRGRVWVLVRRR